MLTTRAESSIRVEIVEWYTQGIQRIATGRLHEDEGRLTVVRLAARFGTVPVLELQGREVHHLYEPRIVDMIGGAWVVQGLERTRERAWVAQEWWVRQVGM